MQITVANITPFMSPAIPDDKVDLVTAWLTAVSARLTAAFGDALPAYIAPAVYDIVAVAVQRRLHPVGADPRIFQQTRADAGVRYNIKLSSLTGWFYPAELGELTSLFQGGGTVTSTRTPAPDAVRFGDRAYRNPYTNDPETTPFGLGSDDEEWRDADTPAGDGFVPDPDDPGYFIPA